MPTPVIVARQCLTSEAAHTLDEAVAVARRRGHAQTTSLHAVSALLSLPSSMLRDACARARNSAYSPRLQFKALDLCLSVSLDRVPSTQLTDDPPVSNSLMAAIKRSQANQRRQPDNFHLYHQISQQPTSVSCIKVELQHLILSILDDPVVSRVFGEAGFRSSEIKLAILRPLPQLLRYSRSRGPPVFLCNLSDNPDSVRRSFSFPFAGSSSLWDGDENFRRIGDVLTRSRGRNPLLLGTCAYDALRSFTEAVDKRKDGVLPVELAGLHVMCIGKDVSKFITDNSDNNNMDSRFKEIAQLVEQCIGPGLVVNFGDLKPFVNENNGPGEAVSYVVTQLTKLLELNYGKLWLMGAAASYESYLKFVGRFPSIEKEWDLQLLPITSIRPSMAESYQRPRSSLMESFVPFGGFFSTPSDLRAPLNGSYYSVSHCHQSDESCEPEALAASKERFTASAADRYNSNTPPSWLQIDELGTAKGLSMKTKGDGTVVDTSSAVVGFNLRGDKKVGDENGGKTRDASPSGNMNLNSTIPGGVQVQMSCTSQSSIPFPAVPKAKVSKLSALFQKVEDGESGMSNSSVCDGSQMSPASVTSVTTDLGLGISPSPGKPRDQHRKEIPKASTKLDLMFKHQSQASSCSSSECGEINLRDPKMLLKALAKKVSWQDEAISVIIRTLTCFQRGKEHGANKRGDIWMNFVGPDRHGKRKIAVSLAETLYGSQENFIFVDLSCEEIKGCDVKFRGKTTRDFLVGELCKKPLSLVFLENADKADMLTQNSLSQAIKTGKIADSNGREVSVNNAIFITSFSLQHNTREPSKFSEETILRTKGWSIKIQVEDTIGGFRSQNLSLVNSSTEVIPNKRKLTGAAEFHEQHKSSDTAKRPHRTSSNWLLDLNLPAEDNEVQHLDDRNSEDVSTTENQNPWLQNLYNQVDETVVFKPYNFDALAERVLKVITRSFHNILGSEHVLSIESQIMQQFLAAGYVSDRDTEVEDWVDQVLSTGFAEVQRRYNLTAHSIVKLATHHEQSPGVYLPPKIIVV
ncbi:hypothetical protein L6164_030080 [Bauhinia variegata]|uniref:Uncharacterized protein n=1 Tax=Bauhinia variegata TaxID=167791 RepID=A0ACB9LAM7_BAUVA|nr:hypothetical protein L6164_030080 [Bauhinia variegata]